MMSFYLVAHYEMVLVPMEYAGQLRFLDELCESYAYASRAESYMLSGIADTKHRHPLTGDEAPLTECLEGIRLPVVSRYHA